MSSPQSPSLNKIERSEIDRPKTAYPKKENGWMPIRDVSERTGVNPVTLRAWERRYGLIKPQRTHKGHRLYAPQDIERIEQIQQWLARGVSVGQVDKLLAPLNQASPSSLKTTRQPLQPESPLQAEPHWQPVLDEGLNALKAGHLTRFDQSLNQVSAIYPAALLMRFFWQPLLHQLYLEPGGARRQLILLQLESYLRNRVGARLTHRNMQSKEQRRLLLSHLPSQQPKFNLWLAALTCTDLNIPITLLDDLPDWSLLHLIDQQQPLSGILLLGNDKIRALKPSEQQLLQALEPPCWLAGPIARIQPEQFEHSGWQISYDWVELLANLRQ